MRKKISLLVLFCALTAHAAVENEDPLEKVVSLGVQNAFEIQSQKLVLDQEHDDQKNNYAKLLPTVKLSASKSYGADESLNTTTGSTSYSGANSASMSVAANWALWDNYANIRNIQVGSKSLEIERLTSRQKIQGYIRGLVSAYLEYEYLLSEREILLVRLKESKITNDESQVLVKVGARTRIDAYDTEIEVANTERDLLEKENSIVAAEKNLANRVNAEAIKKLPRLDLLKIVPYYMKSFEKEILEILDSGKSQRNEEWNEALSRRNPELQTKKLTLEKSEMELKQKRLSYFPSTSISLEHTVELDRYLADDVTGPRTALQSSSISFGLSWTFWDWFSTARTIRNSERDFDIKVLDYRESDKKARVEIENSVQQVAIYRKTIATSRLVLEKAAAQLRYSQEMYRLGRITLLQMQQATRRHYEAQIALAARLKDYYIMAASLLYSLGEDLTPPGTDLRWIR